MSVRNGKYLKKRLVVLKDLVNLSTPHSLRPLTYITHRLDSIHKILTIEYISNNP